MMKHALAAAISSAAILMASDALADGGPEAPPPPPPPVYQPPPEYNWYTTIFAGAAISPSLSNDVTFFDPIDPLLDVRVKFDTDLKTGYLLGWTVGYRPMGLFGSSWFAIRPEAELSLRHANVDFKQILGFNNDNDAILVGGNIVDKFADPADVLSLMFNGWLDFNFMGVQPYVGGGIGVGWSNFPAPGSFLPGFRSTKFAWQAGGGINYDINSRVFVGVGYRYFRTSFNRDVTVVVAGPIGEPLDTVIELDAPINFDLNFHTHEVLFNLGVRF